MVNLVSFVNINISITSILLHREATEITYESFPDFTGQPVWWTGKICLTKHDFTRLTPYENNQQKKKNYKSLSLNEDQ